MWFVSLWNRFIGGMQKSLEIRVGETPESCNLHSGEHTGDQIAERKVGYGCLAHEVSEGNSLGNGTCYVPSQNLLYFVYVLNI